MSALSSAEYAEWQALERIETEESLRAAMEARLAARTGG